MRHFTRVIPVWQTAHLGVTIGDPRGFGDLGRMGSWRVVVIILRDFGEQAHYFGDLGSHAKK